MPYMDQFLRGLNFANVNYKIFLVDQFLRTANSNAFPVDLILRIHILFSGPNERKKTSFYCLLPLGVIMPNLRTHDIRNVCLQNIQKQWNMLKSSLL